MSFVRQGPIVLALGCVVVLLAIGAISRREVDLQEASFNDGRRNTEEVAQQDELLWLASALVRPGNDVFVDLDVEDQRFRFEVAAAQYKAAEQVMVDRRRGFRVGEDLARIHEVVERITSHTYGVFDAFDNGEPELASAQMALLDARVPELQRAFRELRLHDAADLSVVEDRRRVEASRLVVSGWTLGAGMLILSLLSVVYTARVLVERTRSDEERERLLTDLQRSRLEAEGANRAKSEFLANMSHEIRTPMTAILGYADLLLDVHQRPSDRLDCIQTIRRNGGHLLQLVNDILDLSKIEAGKLDVESIETDPGVVLAEVASLMQVRASEQGLEFDIVYVGPVPTRIVTDPTRLRQILLNLVGNALKFTERGGVKVAVRAFAERQRLEFEVTDTGAGMSPEALGRLFKPFTQADSSTTRQFGGTGLGLTISRRLAKILGGDISVRSVLGAGSTFSVDVATGPLEGVACTSSPNQRVVAATRQELTRVDGRILLAEDGPDNQRLIHALLRMAGGDVTIVDNGRSAVDVALTEEAAGRPFGVILMDMQMPVLDGYGATSLLRSHGYRRPIVALTAHAMQGDREKCVRAGCDDHETKPVDRASLLRTVARYLGNPVAEAVVADAEPTPVAPTVAAPEGSLEPLRSTYADDPDMEPLIRDFVSELPVRFDEMVDANVRGERDKVRRVAHQLRGAGGAYGFGVVTDLCRVLEETATKTDEDLGDQLNGLGIVVRRISLAA